MRHPLKGSANFRVMSHGRTSSSVCEWLRSLRHSSESYDDFCCPVTVFNKSRHHDDTVTMRPRDDDIYVNLWECDSVKSGPVLDLNYGRICRLSLVNYENLQDCISEERVENLRVLPVVFETLSLDVSEDVMLWKKELRYSYCSEDEEFFDCEELLSSIQDVSSSAQITESTKQIANNKPKNFPKVSTEIDSKVELRQTSIPQRLARSKTVDFEVSSRRKKPLNASNSANGDRKDRFEFKNATKMTLSDDTVIKLKKNQRFLYENGDLYVDNGETIKTNVKLNPGAKILPNKKQVLMTDTDDNVYHITFVSSKDAKMFLVFEQKYLPSAVTMTSGVTSSPLLQSEKRTIKRTLLGLLGKRASRDFLERSGILRNEPIFGNTLAEVVRSSLNGIPDFIRTTVELIESPGNITSTGIYRTPGNMAVIQKIRCHVDEYKLDILQEYRNDVDVLTGCLKMFFRELKEPVITKEVCNDIYIMLSEGKTLTDDVILSKLSKPNRDVLDYLLRHLAKVCHFKEDNKMDVHNMAICWGPSLIGHSDHSTNDVFIQTSKMSKVMEGLISHYYNNNVNNKTSNVKDDVDYEIVKRFTDLIESHLTVEGIYRKSGSSVKIDTLIKKLGRNHNLTDLDLSKSDVHDLCCVLKRFLANLDPPLINDQQFDRFCSNYVSHDIAMDDRTKRQMVRDFVDTLPRRDCLLLLVTHLRKVASCRLDNKMSLSQLASLFTLTLMPSSCRRDKQKEKLFMMFLMDLLAEETKDDGNLPDLVRMSTYDNMTSTVDGAGNLTGVTGFIDDGGETVTGDKTDEFVHTKL